MTVTNLPARRTTAAIAVPEPKEAQVKRRMPVAAWLIIAAFPGTFAAMALLGASKPTRAGVILAVGLLSLVSAVVVKARAHR